MLNVAAKSQVHSEHISCSCYLISGLESQITSQFLFPTANVQVSAYDFITYFLILLFSTTVIADIDNARASGKRQPPGHVYIISDNPSRSGEELPNDPIMEFGEGRHWHPAPPPCSAQKHRSSLLISRTQTNSLSFIYKHKSSIQKQNSLFRSQQARFQEISSS